MPDSASDPLQPGYLIDPSGGGSDGSAYFALSPGGRFPGDISNYLGHLQAFNTGGQLGNGNENQSNIQIPGQYGRLISALLNGMIMNARTGSAGQAPGNPLTDGGFPWQVWSGPGASYGPPGGSLNGLLDIGNPTPVDGRDDPFSHLDTAGIPNAPSGGGGKHGGGGSGGSFGFTPYSGVPFTSSFVGYSPTQPGAVQHAAPLIQTLVNAGLPSSSSPGKSSGGKGGGGSAGGSGGGGHKAPTWAIGGTPPPVPPGGEQRPDGRIFDASGRTIWAPAPGQKIGTGGGGGTGAGGGVGNGAEFTNPTQAGQFGGVLPKGGIPINLFGPNGVAGTIPTDRDSHGVNFNNLDKGTPGWLRDPTQGIQNTAGFPNATLPDPKGMTADQYVTLLHDLGWSQEDIAGIVSNYGFHIGNPQAGPPSPDGRDPGQADNVSYGWGTGPVVRGANGYAFANGTGGGSSGRAQQSPNAASTLNSGANAWWMMR